MSFEQRTQQQPIVDLYPGRAFLARFTPGHSGTVTVTTAVGADPCNVVAELRDGAGAVHARFTGKLAKLSMAATITVDRPRSPQWTVHLTNTSDTVVGGGDLIVSYPADVVDTPITMARLDDLAAMARRELHPEVTLSGGKLHVAVDERFASHLPDDWKAFPAVIPVPVLPDLVIDRLAPVNKVGLRFAPGSAEFPRGCIEVVLQADDIHAKAAGIPLGGATAATLTVRVGVGIERQRMFLGPVVVALDWKATGLANLGAVRSYVENKLRTKIEAVLATDAIAPLGKATQMAMKIFRMVEWIDLRITAAGLVMRHVAAPTTAATPPNVTAPPPRGRMKRLVVVMMENRSYDHMLRSLFASRADLGAAVGYGEDLGGKHYQVEESATSKVRDDPPHGSWSQLNLQAASKWCEAYDRAHASKPAATRHNDPGEVLRYLRAAVIPTYRFLADQACVCVDWRAAIPGQTWPNRNYGLSGSSDGILDNGKGGFDFYDLLTVCDVLEAQRVRWRYYYSDVPFLELYRRWAGNPPRPDGSVRMHRVTRFLDDAATGDLPTVTWIEPNISDFGSEAGTDDHPPADAKHGQYFIRQVYEAMRAYQTKRLKDADAARRRGDAAAEATARADANDWLLVVTYDEHGGFWDSAGIGPAVDDDFADTRRRGFRVPGFFISPWLGRSICKVPLDHASMVRTVLDQFCAPEGAISRLARVAHANGFADILDGGAGGAWPQPLPAARAMPPAPALTADFTPPDFGQEAQFDTIDLDRGDGVRQWEEFRRARDRVIERREAAAAVTIVDGAGGSEGGVVGATTVSAAAPAAPIVTAPTLTPGATFDALAVTGADDDLIDAIAAATGWRRQPLSRLASLFVPDDDVSIGDAWKQLAELRARFPRAEFEALWDAIGKQAADTDLDTTAPLNWALDAICARDAWKLPSPSGRHRGAGIVVAHLDTGWTDHRELAGVFDRTLGWDFVDGDPVAQDPLHHGPLWFPGHGTATASVLASREVDGGTLIGAAPEATLLEFRISRSVVHLSTRRMAKAILAAVDAGAHVISISAGGLRSRLLRAAVKSATDRGVVVVAAAGNYVGMVVWPAQYPEVIALGATTPTGAKWRWSSSGPRVALAAPGGSVDCAQAGGDETRVHRSSGTSFSAALAAGAIATWLSFHGRDRLLELYRPSGLAMAARRLLCSSAAGPALHGLGAGRLDLCAFLATEPRFDEQSWFGQESSIVDGDTPADAAAEQRQFFETLGGLVGEDWRALASAHGAAT